MPAETPPCPPARTPARAFVIEDERVTRQLICAHVERIGFVPVEVEPDPGEIDAAIASAGPDDAMIVDIILGADLDGFEVIRKLGAVGFRGRVLVISGYGSDYAQILGSLAGGLQLRVTGTLEKPIHPAALERCLRG